ncbi:MAG: S41 family peptidase, partial [Chitinophagaceae bacterium]
MGRMLFLSFAACCMQLILYAQSFEYTSKEKLREDVKYLVQTIENVHPNPYHSISKEKFYQVRDSITGSFPDSISVIDSWRNIAFLIASLDEGHSDLKMPKEFSEAINHGRILFFPITVSKLTDEGLIVRSDLSGDSLLRRGDVLLSINDIPASEIRNCLCSTIGGLQAWRELIAVQDFTARLYLHGIRAPYKIAYRQSETTSTAFVKGLTKDSLVANATRLRKAGAVTTNEPYRFSRINDNIGYLDFRTMSTPYEPFAKFLEDSFTAIKQSPVKGLIVDLRKNGGGNSMLGYKLLTYITDKAFRMAGGSKWKVSDEYTQSKMTGLTLAAGKDRHIKKYLSMSDGEILTMESKAEKPA